MTIAESKKTDLRLGIITFVALGLMIAAISFAGGEKGLLFHKASYLTAWLDDVGGLKKGCTVSMGGMAIGKVTGIDFVDTEQKTVVEVKMEIRSDFRHRVKTDSYPQVKTQGMLGDRYIEISVGSKEAQTLQDNTPLVGQSAGDFDTTLKQANAALSETTKMLTAVNEHQGTVGQFLYDKKFYDQILTISEELNSLILDFKKNPRRYIKFSVF